ncbi:MAG: hypothetical protein WA840_05605 [Caulobacteraceae bacterium]
MLPTILALLAWPALSAPANAALARVPRELGAFMERRAECEHWAGEEPYDKGRAAEIDHAVKVLHCARVEADERALRRRYARRPDVLKVLGME